MKANWDGFKVVEIVVKKVKWVWNNNNDRKEDDFPNYGGNTFLHPPLG